jgi:hypothetical protein
MKAHLPWYLQPGSWPYWPTPPLTGASMPHGGLRPQGSPSMAANLSGGLFGNLAQRASGTPGDLARSGGLLGNLGQRTDYSWADMATKGGMAWDAPMGPSPMTFVHAD